GVVKDKPTKAEPLLKRSQSYGDEKTRFLWSAIFTFPIFLLSMVPVQFSFSTFLQFLLATVVVLFIGFEFIKTATLQIRKLAFSMDTLIAIGSGAAYIYSVLNMIVRQENELYFETGAMIITLILLGRYLESKARGKAGDAIRELIELKPRKARVIKDGCEIETVLSEIVVGDELIIRPGEKIPLDGLVIDGETTINESTLTGESMPVIKTTGGNVYAGTINQNGNIRIKVEKVELETLLAHIIKRVEEAQMSKAPIQRIADKTAGIFVPIVIGIAAVTMLIWLMLGYPFSSAFTASISVLVIACPCALGLATPTAIVVSTGRAAKEGILIKNASSLELAVKTDILVFDKTGTITEGKPEVTGVYNVGDYSDSEIDEIIGACEKFSEHPIGSAVVRYAKEKGVKLTGADKFLSLPGKGMFAKCKGKDVYLGNKLLMDENDVDITTFGSTVNKLNGSGNTVFFLAVDGSVKAVIAIADTIRESSKDAIAQIKSFGITPVMLTGDDNLVAERVAKHVGIDHVKSRLSPEDKINEILNYKEKGNVVGMVGDGINDAPALAAADVSFAIGSGTDIAIESAEITLAKGNIAKVAETIRISQQTMKIVKQNLFWAFGYNFIAIPIAALGMLNPMIAAGAMALSSISVVTNSLRLR
ncbi:MAG: copper-translocating P-type ATPase, partial [Candidatus Anammoxibacter sp.]